MKKNTSPFVIGAGAVAVFSLTGAVFATGALAASTPDEQPLPNYTWAVPSDAPTRDPLPSYDPGAAAADTPSEHAEVYPTEQP